MDIINEIKTITSVNELMHLKSIIDSQIEENYDRKENYMFHETMDEYIYQVDYQDGTYHRYWKGAEAYQEYIDNEEAFMIQRKTKDLFPTFEILSVKS